MNRFPVYPVLFALALSLGGVRVCAEGKAKSQVAAADEVQWEGFDQGLKLASQKGKYTLVDLYTDWCGYCRKMDMTTFRDKAVVAKLSRDFVSIKFNAESPDAVSWKGNRYSQASLANEWGVQGFPTLLFLNSKGEIIGNFPSYADSDLMMKLLGYIASGSREKGQSFDDYIKKEAS